VAAWAFCVFLVITHVLITAVHAITDSVTFPLEQDALPTSTAVLQGCTRVWVRHGTVPLIAAIVTLLHSVTSGESWHASHVPALPEVAMAFLTVRLVGAVIAVLHAIAVEALRDAGLPVRAEPVAGVAAVGWTKLFVRAVIAVLATVAHPLLVDAHA